MKRIIKYKNYILGVIGILLTLTMVVGAKYLMKPKYEELPEVKLVKLRDINSNKSFAIMIQNGDGYKEYTSTDNKWPGEGYKFKEAKCTDNNGTLVNDAITFADGKATLKTNKTIYCTLYFDYKGTMNILREKDTQGYLSEDFQGGMYRFQAAFPECDNESECKNATKMANWICFGTTENCGTDETDSDDNSIPDGIDKYMYRIIGITEEGQLYLLKETFLKEGSGTTFSWNDKYYRSGERKYSCDDTTCPEWNTSLLFRRINGTSNGTTLGTGSYQSYADTDIFVDSSEYEYLKSGDSINGTKDNKGSEWYQLIADHEWMYGDVGDPMSFSSYSGQVAYEMETGQADVLHGVLTDEGLLGEESYRWNQKVNAKISLMYIHDYYYGFYDGQTEESRGNSGSFDNLKHSWLTAWNDGYNRSCPSEWFSTRSSNVNSTVNAYNGRFADVYRPFNNLSEAIGVRPVFYLESEGRIASGSGTKSDPFILEIKKS